MAVHERLSETQEIVLKNLVIFGLPGLSRHTDYDMRDSLRKLNLPKLRTDYLRRLKTVMFP